MKNQHIQKQIDLFREEFKNFLKSVHPSYGEKIEAFLKTSQERVWKDAEEETAQKFDNFKVVEYNGDSKDFPTTDFAWKSGQIYVMVKIKELIESLKQTT